MATFAGYIGWNHRFYNVEVDSNNQWSISLEPVPDSTQNVDLSGYVSKEELPTTIDTALARAKESGEFDGADGEAGYTPVRGTDYWTAADIAEIKSYVDTAILGGAW